MSILKKLKVWLKADLNPLPEFVRAHELAKIPATAQAQDEDYSGDDLEDVGIEDADVVNSFDPSTGLHRPILDIDCPARLLPSTTPGHFHLYIDKPMSWSRYTNLLHALSRAGVIEPGYAAVSIKRGYSSVRLPWVKKKIKEPST